MVQKIVGYYSVLIRTAVDSISDMANGIGGHKSVNNEANFFINSLIL